MPTLEKPALATILESVASIMNLDEGQHRLELLFSDGHLRQWWTHSERNGANALARFDERARWLV